MEKIKTKTKLIKSKSSNSALTKNNKYKKSSSSTGLQNILVKKRGLYVKSHSKTSSRLNNTVPASENQKNNKGPKRQSRDNESYILSVSDLFSQSSTATQFPESTANMKIKTRTLKKNATVGKNVPEPHKTEKKKRKYTSKDIDDLDRANYLEVLQPRKDLVMTPSIKQSNTSKLEVEDFDSIKWSDFLPRLVKPDEDEIQIEKEKKLSHLVKEVNEGRMTNEDVVSKKDDPKTLVAVHKSKTDNGLYSFFVDLLETTFNVYNVDTHYSGVPNVTSVDSTNISFEMNESVAKKLDVLPGREPPRRFDSPCHSSYCNDKVFNNFLCKPSEAQSKRINKQPRQEPQKLARRKKIQSDFVFSKPKTPAPQSKSATSTQQRKSLKQNNKKNLIKMFKEQLKMDDYSYEEPQNLYQALKVMAKTKQKSQKTIRFDAPKVDDNENCTFKCRKLLSPRMGSRQKHKDNESGRKPRVSSPKGSEYSHCKRRDLLDSSSEDDLSNHSLEVYNVDYMNTNQIPTKKSIKKQNQLILTYHSSSESEVDSKPFDPIVPMMQQIIMTVETICSADKYNSTDFTDCFTTANFTDEYEL